jgi:DNA polymerase I-like protein with 3'-5' exonuclease and polymerase domains
MILADAKTFRHQFFQLYPGIRHWHKRVKRAIEIASNFQAVNFKLRWQVNTNHPQKRNLFESVHEFERGDRDLCHSSQRQFYNGTIQNEKCKLKNQCLDWDRR